MSPILVRIKRCCVKGRVRFTFKAELELSRDQISKADVIESLLNAQDIYKTIRARGSGRQIKSEKLYIIQSFTFENLLIYSKGKLVAKGKEEIYYILISSKLALGG